jgi:hypothetical protein
MAPSKRPGNKPYTSQQISTPASAVSKYGKNRDSFIDLSKKNIPQEAAAYLKDLGDHGLAKKTWSSYATAERLLFKFHKDRNIKPELPLTEDTTLLFIYWLASERKLKAGTISNYLAGIRQLHITKGLPEPRIRSDLVNLILQGLLNKENKLSRKTDSQRKPITKELMALLKQRTRAWDTSVANKRLFWAVATNLFHGAFRIGELLCGKTSEFDPDFELTTNDVASSASANQFKLKAPKEDRKGKSTIVDVYATGGPFCPVHALNRWKDVNKHWPDNQPAFRWDDGRPFTQNHFRKILNERLEGFVDNPEDIFCSHSFRIGIASMLGKLGYGDEDIKAVGRWSSRAFEEYLRLPRTKRMQMAKCIKL